MEQVMPYQNRIVTGKAWVINDSFEKNYRMLREAAMRFTHELAIMDKSCLNSNEKSDELLTRVTAAVDKMNRICEEFERGANYDKEIVKEAQIRFREMTEPVISKSYFMNRARVWPLGHQGDYSMLESVYKNSPRSEGVGYYLDKCCLNMTLTRGVKNRIKKLENILRGEISKMEKPGVLNVACGSCRELVGLAPEIVESRAKVICIDNDDDALEFAQLRLSNTEAASQIQFYKYNALRMFDHELNMISFGMQDIIYSVGFFDYLDDDFLVKMLRSLYLLLNPGGKLVMTFKDADHYESVLFHWLVDWDGFLQRREDDFHRIIDKADIPQSAISQSRDESGCIIFSVATK